MLFRNYPNERLLAELHQTYANERSSVVKVLRLLDEIERRRLHAELGYSSLFRFCLDVLNMSESQAGLRIAVARAAGQFQVIFEMIERGEIHLSGVGLVASRLTAENHRALLDAARRKTKDQIAELLAEWFPKPDQRTSIRRLPAPAASSAAPTTTAAAPELPLAPPRVTAHSPAAPLVPTEVRTPEASPPAASPPPPSPSASAPRPGVVQPLSVDRYAVKFTASKRCRDLIERAKALMSHRSPKADVGEVVEAALEAFVAQLEKKKFKKTDRPRSAPSASTKPGARSPTAAVQRAVAERDGGRCTYVSPDGRHCAEERFLEFDHIDPAALGGPPTVDNLRLRCRAHNSLTARRQFGDDYVDLRAAGFRPSNGAASTQTTEPALGP